jgi:hypothetical protein
MYKLCDKCQQYHPHTFDGKRWYAGKCPPKVKRPPPKPTNPK